MSAKWIRSVMLVAAFVAAAFAFYGQPATDLPAERRLDAKALREDFSILRFALVEAHAGLYVYNSPAAIRRALDGTAATLRDTTETGFYDAVARVLAVLRDGHTRSLPPEGWMERYAKTARVLPVRVRFLGRRAYVRASTDPQIPVGSEILTVNRQPIPQIVDRMTQRLPGDGYIETGKLAQLSAQFEFYYYLFVKRPDSFELEIRRQGDKTAVVRTAAVPVAALPTERDPAKAEPLKLSFVDDSRVAVLRIATFAADEITAAGVEYPTFLDTSFDTILRKGARDLIIDLRGNDGGRDAFGAMLLAHLVDRPFQYYRRLEARTNQISFWRHTNLDSSFNARFGAGLSRDRNGRYEFPAARHSNLGLQQPRLPAYAGRVWVLTDGGTFSTAAEFCAVTKSLGRAVFVGQETGGTYAGNSSGTFAILTLPHSGVRVVVPLVRYILAVKPVPLRGRGVMPDHEVPENADVLQGTDPVIERALGLVRASPKRSEHFRRYS